MYTNDAGTLGHALSRDVSHTSAIQQEPAAQKIEPIQAQVQAHEFVQGMGMGR
jgi:hypothetical protein